MDIITVNADYKEMVRDHDLLVDAVKFIGYRCYLDGLFTGCIVV